MVEHQWLRTCTRGEQILPRINEYNMQVPSKPWHLPGHRIWIGRLSMATDTNMAFMLVFGESC